MPLHSSDNADQQDERNSEEATASPFSRQAGPSSSTIIVKELASIITITLPLMHKSAPATTRDIKLVGVPIDSIPVAQKSKEETYENVLIDLGPEQPNHDSSNSGTTDNELNLTESSNPPKSDKVKSDEIAPEMIKVPGSDGRRLPLVDVISSSIDDPFSLESFEIIIRNRARVGKDFIIARVKTVDAVGDKNLFHYYCAHQINKVLFRTQPEEGLLHRMKAKNPLNNMTIEGDVHYFSIRAQHVIELLNYMHLQQLNKRAAAAATRGPPLEYQHASSPMSHFNISSKISRIIHQLISPSLDVSATAASRDAFGMTNTASSASNTLSSRPSTLVLPSSVNSLSSSAPLTAQSSKLRKRHANNEDHLQQEDRMNSRNNSGNNNDDGREVDIHFHREQEDGGEDSPLLQTHRDHLQSFLNHQGTLVASAGGGTVTKVQSGGKGVERAASHESEDSSRSDGVEDAEGGLWYRKLFNTTSGPKLMTGKRLSADDVFSGMVQNFSQGRSVLSPIKSSSLVSTGDTLITHQDNRGNGDRDIDVMQMENFYVAEYIGSDDDFLYKAEVRKYFRRHALEADDAVLFTLPPDTSDSNTGREPEELRLRTLMSSEGWLISGKPFWAITIAYWVGSLLVLRYLVPQLLIFIVTFLVTFSYCIFVVVVMP